MAHEYLDAIEAAIPELQAGDRVRLRAALDDWCDAQLDSGELPPIDRAVGELRKGLGLREVPYVGPAVAPPAPPASAGAASASNGLTAGRSPAKDLSSPPLPSRLKPRSLMLVGASLVAVGVGFSWWNATPAFTLDAMSVDGDSIEVLWVEAEQPSRVVRCSPGELTVTARISADTESTLRDVVLPYLDDAWAEDGSVERIGAEASAAGSVDTHPIEGYEVGGDGNEDHDLRLVYRIDDCDSIDAMPVGTALSVAYEFRGRDRGTSINLPERLAFIDEDCKAGDIAKGECPS